MADVTFSWSPPQIVRDPTCDRDPGRPVSNADVQVHTSMRPVSVSSPFCAHVPAPEITFEGQAVLDWSYRNHTATAPVTNSDAVQIGGRSLGSPSDHVIHRRHPDALPCDSTPIQGDASVSMCLSRPPVSAAGDAFLAPVGAVSLVPGIEGRTMLPASPGGPVSRGTSDVTLGPSADLIRSRDVTMMPAGEGPILSGDYTGVICARTDAHLGGAEVAEGGRGRTVSSEACGKLRGR